MVTTYGMSETCGGCVYDGVPLDGVYADVDPDGRILLRGPVVGRGYRLLPGHRAFAGRGTVRTFRTDDVGRIDDGRLQILGRIDDVLISGGIKIAPAALEAAIARAPGIAEVVVVGVPDDEWGQLAVAVVVAQFDGSTDAALLGPPALLQLVRRACADAGIPGEQQPRAAVTVPELPLRGPGKPDRIAAAALARVLIGGGHLPDPGRPDGGMASGPRLSR